VLGHSPKVPLRRGLRGPGLSGQHPAWRRCRCEQGRRPGRLGRFVRKKRHKSSHADGTRGLAVAAPLVAGPPVGRETDL
jgi:hypothetical protein